MIKTPRDKDSWGRRVQEVVGMREIGALGGGGETGEMTRHRMSGQEGKELQVEGWRDGSVGKDACLQVVHCAPLICPPTGPQYTQTETDREREREINKYLGQPKIHSKNLPKKIKINEGLG